MADERNSLLEKIKAHEEREAALWEKRCENLFKKYGYSWDTESFQPSNTRRPEFFQPKTSKQQPLLPSSEECSKMSNAPRNTHRSTLH